MEFGHIIDSLYREHIATMHADYFGDSYDVVKRFFCQELQALGYGIVAGTCQSL
jgi:hypothetical protein